MKMAVISSRRISRDAISRIALPLLTLGGLAALWQISVILSPASLIPGPWPVLMGAVELWVKGLLLKYVVASLFRVTCGYLLGVLLAVPAGLLLGWFRRGGWAAGPLLQILRPISPIAWIPVSILWFGVGDLGAVFLIFLASFLPLAAASMNAVANIDPAYLRAGRNFGLSEAQLITSVLFPAVLPQLVVALRLALGIAWLVVVASEMIAVNSGLGFLIVDARNAGNRYDLVVAGMALIGLIGLILDVSIRRMEKLRSLQWGYGGAR